MGAPYIVPLCPRRVPAAVCPRSLPVSMCAVGLSECASSVGTSPKAAMICTPSDISCERRKAARGKYHRYVFAVPLCLRKMRCRCALGACRCRCRAVGPSERGSSVGTSPKAAMTYTRLEISCKGLAAAMVVIFRTHLTSAAMSWETIPAGNSAPSESCRLDDVTKNPPPPDCRGLTGRCTQSSSNDLHAP